MIKLIKGSCFGLHEVSTGSIDVVATDPPYGMSFQSNYRKEKHIKIENDSNLEWLPGWVLDLKRVSKEDAHLYIFCSWHNVDVFKKEFESVFNVKNILIWEKNNTGMGDLYGDYAPKYEMCLFISNGNKKLNNGRHSNIIKAKRTDNELHPTQKPVNLMEFLIEKSSKPGDLILDCFSGSGTTAIACHNLNRDFIGYEINEDYYNAAMKRIEQHTNQQKLF